MTDDEFVEAVRRAEVHEFHHVDHIRLTWAILRNVSGNDAMDKVREIITGFAARHGQAAKYHETITRFWVELVGYATTLHPEASSVEDLTAVAPHLLDKSLPWRHWSNKRPMSSDARAHWLPPDLIPLPWAA